MKRFGATLTLFRSWEEVMNSALRLVGRSDRSAPPQKEETNYIGNFAVFLLLSALGAVMLFAFSKFIGEVSGDFVYCFSPYMHHLM